MVHTARRIRFRRLPRHRGHLLGRRKTRIVLHDEETGTYII